jgi:hypothetical protein
MLLRVRVGVHPLPDDSREFFPRTSLKHRLGRILGRNLYMKIGQHDMLVPVHVFQSYDPLP